MSAVTRKLAQHVLDVVDQGLSSGLGSPTPGQMCVEAAVCYAMGLPHGDDPPCVNGSVRQVKIDLNDMAWSSPSRRAAGMRRVAVAQLGSLHIDAKIFLTEFVMGLVTGLLPALLREIYPDNVDILKRADVLAHVTDLETAETLLTAFKLQLELLDEDSNLTSLSEMKEAVDDLARAASRLYGDEADVGSAAGRLEYVMKELAEAARDHTYYDANLGYGRGNTARDKVLAAIAEVAVQALKTCGAEGAAWVDELAPLKN